MLKDEIKNIKSTDRDLGNFGFLVGGILFALGVWFIYSGRHAWQTATFIGAVFVFIGLIFPRVLWPIHRAWMMFGLLSAWVMTRVILSIIFFIVVTPLAFFLQLFRKRPLDLRFKTREAVTTYWHRREVKRSTRERLEQQF